MIVTSKVMVLILKKRMSTYEEMFNEKKRKMLESNLRGLNTQGWYDEEGETQVLMDDGINYGEFLTLIFFFFPHAIFIMFGLYNIIIWFKDMYKNKHLD